MLTTVADPYRGFPITGSHHANREVEKEEELIAYGLPHPHPRQHRSTEAPCHLDATHLPSFSPHPPTSVTGVHHPGSPAVHHQPQSVFMEAPHTPLLPCSTQYSPCSLEFSAPQESKKRSWSENRDSSHDMGLRIGKRQSMQPGPFEGPAPTTVSSEMVFPIHDHTPSSHPPSQHGYAPFSLSHPQHHHHHRLPHQASLHLSQGPGLNRASPSSVGGRPSLVGQSGMPNPRPPPRGPKMKFTPEDDMLLLDLKEVRNLTWAQIEDFFPGRTSGTLQVRYCNKLKTKGLVWTDEKVGLLSYSLAF